MIWINAVRIPYFKHANRQAWANSVDQGQTPQNAASVQDLLCLPLIVGSLDTSATDTWGQ